MSWDIFIQDLPKDIQTVDEIPEDFQPSSIGSRTDLIKRMRILVPEINFDSSSHAWIEGEQFSISVQIGEEDIVHCIGLFVRGNGDDAARVVSDLMVGLGLRAIDTSSETGLFQPGEEAQANWKRWRDYRDSVIKDKDETPTNNRA